MDAKSSQEIPRLLAPNAACGKWLEKEIADGASISEIYRTPFFSKISCADPAISASERTHLGMSLLDIELQAELLEHFGTHRPTEPTIARQ